MESTKPSKTLYDASVGEIATKNFFVGFMRGLGGFFATLLSWVVLYYLITQVVVPQFSGLLNQAGDLIKSVERIQGGVGGATNLMNPSAGSGLAPSAGSGQGSSGSKGIVIPPEMIQQFQQLQKK